MTATKLDTARRFAYDRTIMVWVRTATSMITFGFTIYKFFQAEREASGPGPYLVGPYEFGLVLVGMGLLSLLLATIEHRQNMQAMRAQVPDMPGSMATVVAALVSVLGILALAVMPLRE